MEGVPIALEADKSSRERSLTKTLEELTKILDETPAKAKMLQNLNHSPSYGMLKDGKCYRENNFHSTLWPSKDELKSKSAEVLLGLKVKKVEWG